MRVIEEHLQNLSTTHINKHQSTRVNEIQWPIPLQKTEEITTFDKKLKEEQNLCSSFVSTWKHLKINFSS